jgi:hypothetical protein
MGAATKEHGRLLTNDEKKSAEAAFRGQGFNPSWSEAARKVYQGISAAMVDRPHSPLGALNVGNKASQSTPQVVRILFPSPSKSKPAERFNPGSNHHT